MIRKPKAWAVCLFFLVAAISGYLSNPLAKWLTSAYSFLIIPINAVGAMVGMGLLYTCGSRLYVEQYPTKMAASLIVIRRAGVYIIEVRNDRYTIRVFGTRAALDGWKDTFETLNLHLSMEVKGHPGRSPYNITYGSILVTFTKTNHIDARNRILASARKFHRDRISYYD